MGITYRWFRKTRCMGILSLSALFLATAALAEEPLLLPSDNDSYLYEGPVGELQELDAIRRHLIDVKKCIIFSVGFIGTAVFLQRIL